MLGARGSLALLMTGLMAVPAALQSSSQEAIKGAQKLHAEAEAALARDDRAAGSALVRAGLALLEETDAAAEDAAAAHARWMLALCAFRAEDAQAEAGAWEQAAAFYRRSAEHAPYAREALRNQAAALGRLLRHHEALAIQERLLEELRRASPFDAQAELWVRWDLAVTLDNLGRPFRAAAMWREIVAELAAREPLDEEEFLLALTNQASVYANTGEHAKEEAVRREIVARYERLGLRGSEECQQARMLLARTLQRREKAEETLALVREVYDEVGPGEDVSHHRLRSRLGQALAFVGRTEEGRPLLEQAVAGLRRLLPPTSGVLQSAEIDLALLLGHVGERQAAIAILTEVLRHREENLSPQSFLRLDAARLLAHQWRFTGDVERARRILERAAATYEGAISLSDEKPECGYLALRLALGDTLRALGDLVGALGIYQDVLAFYETILPDDEPALLRIRRAIASTHWDTGDFAGALPMYRKVHDVLRATRAEDDRDLASARINLGATLLWLGDVDSHVELNRAAEAALRRAFSEEHSELALPRFNVGLGLSLQGKHAEAALVLEEVLALATLEESRGWVRWCTEGELGHVLWRLGEVKRAEELLRSGLAGMEGLAAADPRERFHAARVRRYLLSLLAESGRAEDLAVELNALLRSLRLRLRELTPLAAREIAEGVRVLRWDLDAALSLARAGSERFDAALFGVAETLRAISGPPEVDRFFAGGPALAALRDEAMRSRRRLHDLVAGISAEKVLPSGAEELATAVRERDRAERELRAALARSPSPDLSAEQVFEALERQSAAVGFLSYARADAGGESEPWFAAFVLTPDHRVQRVDLGPAVEIERLVERWRTAIGQPILRGLPIEETQKEGPAEIGLALRERVLDPVLERTVGARKLYLCLDGALHLVPLDALPLGEGRLGAELELVLLPSFRVLVAPHPRSTPAPALLALGGVAFNAELEGRFLERDRSSGPDGLLFRPLPATLEEVRSLAALFGESFGSEARLLTGEAATKAALLERAGQASFLHLATHGYFAAGAGAQDGRVVSPAPTFVEAVRGLAPATLCGLALAGANRGRDSLGRVPGILTAEELAGLDLRRCELAVLSACETNVGIESAGRGIQSLQAALHAAGVATAITSLWQVSDDAARDLMLDFYQRLWVQGKTPARALWEAKLALQRRGAPERDWAGWVLTGSSP